MKVNETQFPDGGNIYLEFPTIKILPLDKVIPHEYHDAQRTTPLVHSLQTSGVLISPPLFSPFDDSSGEYMVLDGANRVAAFKELGIPHILGQVIPHNSPSLNLSTWNHVICDMATSVLLKSLRVIPNAKLVEIKKANDRKHQDDDTPVSVQTPDDRKYRLVTTNEDIAASVNILREVVNTYKEVARFDRIPLGNIDSIKGLYKDLTAIVCYPQFSIAEIFDLCRAGHLLPSGVTRFHISPRALRLYYPLDELASSKSLEDKNQTLNHWLQERVSSKSVRFYAEPTVVFDEL